LIVFLDTNTETEASRGNPPKTSTHQHDAQRRTRSNREQRGPHRSASFISSLYFRYAT
jgi:hypothetical protein